MINLHQIGLTEQEKFLVKMWHFYNGSNYNLHFSLSSRIFTYYTGYSKLVWYEPTNWLDPSTGMEHWIQQAKKAIFDPSWVTIIP